MSNLNQAVAWLRWLPVQPHDYEYKRTILAALEKTMEQDKPNDTSGPNSTLQSDQGCECSMRERVAGDGCDDCNPKLALEYANEALELLEAENQVLRGVLRMFGDKENWQWTGTIWSWDDGNPRGIALEALRYDPYLDGNPDDYLADI